MSLLEPLLQDIQEAVRAVQIERYLRYKYEVDLLDGEGSVGGDEARVAAHELDEGYAVVCAVGLVMGIAYDVVGDGEGCLEAERLLDEVYVVVYCLGYAGDGYLELPVLYLFMDGMGAVQRAVAPDAEEDVDVQYLEGVYHLAYVLVTARGAEEGAAREVYLADHGSRHLHHLVVILRDKPFVAVSYPQYPFYPVAVEQLVDEAADDVVDPRAQSAAGDDTHLRLGGFKEYCLFWSCLLE